MRKHLCGAITLVALLLLNTPLPAQPLVPGAQWDALHYQAQIEPDLVSGSVTGSVAVRAMPLKAGLTSLQLNAGALEVSSVTESGLPLVFEKTGSVVNITLAAASFTGQPRTIAVSYHGAPKSGITFLPAAVQVYTAFSTSQWMPCIDAPADRATLRLAVTVPAHYQVAGNGRLLREINVRGGKKNAVNGSKMSPYPVTPMALWRASFVRCWMTRQSLRCATWCLNNFQKDKRGRSFAKRAA
jgi:aminopeptidase N